MESIRILQDTYEKLYAITPALGAYYGTAQIGKLEKA